MAEFLIGQSYYLRLDRKLWEAMQPYPPLGALYAASSLRERGHDVGLFDSMLAESTDEWLAALDRQRPRFAVLYEDGFNYLSKMCLLRMRGAGFQMIQAAKARGCTVLVSGSDATDHLAEYLDQGADYLLIGEGENTLGELADHLTGRAPGDLAHIHGLAYRTADGNLMRTPPRALIKDLDVLPFPAWDLVDIPRYRKIWYARHGYYSMNLVTTRGCPYHCNWCAKPIYGQRYNTRSPENVADEIAWLKRTYQPDHIWFADDILGLKPGWMARFAAALRERGAVVPFKCLTRVDLLKPDVIAALKRAGCQTVWVGAESGSQKILDAMDKGTRVEEIYAAARGLQAAGIKVGFFLQFGYPGETRADIERTLQMVRDCRPDDIGVSVSYPLPGTKFYDNVRASLGAQTNWLDSDDLAMLYRGPFVPELYRTLHRVVHHEFRARKRWETLRAGLRRPASLRPRHARQAAAIAYHLAALPPLRRRLRQLECRPHTPLTVRPAEPSPLA